jgi:hypothetical protein
VFRAAVKGCQEQAPDAICEVAPTNAAYSAVNPATTLRQRSCAALALSLTLQVLYRHHHLGTGRHRRGHAAGTGRGLGDAARHAENPPGYDPDVTKTARSPQIMENLVTADRRLAVKVSIHQHYVTGIEAI